MLCFAYCMWYVACCTFHAARSMVHVPGCVLHAWCKLHAEHCTLCEAYNTLLPCMWSHAARSVLYVACCICMVYVACCMLHAARCMLFVACCMLHYSCCTMHVVRCTSHVVHCAPYIACRTLHAVLYVLDTPHIVQILVPTMQHATRNVQHATCNTQRTACNVQRARAIVYCASSVGFCAGMLDAEVVWRAMWRAACGPSILHVGHVAFDARCMLHVACCISFTAFAAQVAQ